MTEPMTDGELNSIADSLFHGNQKIINRTTIQRLLAEVRRLRQDLRIADCIPDIIDGINEDKKELHRRLILQEEAVRYLQARCDALAKALGFYAKEDNWSEELFDHDYRELIFRFKQDGGNTARQALEATGYRQKEVL